MRVTGIDINGAPGKLGDLDSDGEIIGFIDADGTCYRDETEKWASRVAGRYLDAWTAWRTAGQPGPPPNPVPFLALAPRAFHLDVLAEIQSQVEMHAWLLSVAGK